MTVGRMVAFGDTKVKPIIGHGRVNMVHFDGVLSEETRAFVVNYTAALADKQGEGVKITLDTRCLKDAMKEDRLSVNIDNDSPIHAGVLVRVTSAGFLNEMGEPIGFTIFQITCPIGTSGFGHNFKFIKDGTNGPRMYVN
jgi:hypothetical protein